MVWMADTRDRRMEEAGDAACVWHVLDAALKGLCEIRDALEAAGFEARAEELHTVVEVLEVDYAVAEKKVMEDIEN